MKLRLLLGLMAVIFLFVVYFFVSHAFVFIRLTTALGFFAAVFVVLALAVAFFGRLK
jgi:hypothetical protein